MEIIFGSRVVIDGKTVSFGTNELIIESNLSYPFCILHAQGTEAKAFRLTSIKLRFFKFKNNEGILLFFALYFHILIEIGDDFLQGNSPFAHCLQRFQNEYISFVNQYPPLILDLVHADNSQRHEIKD